MTVRVFVEVTVSVEVAAGVVLAASALTAQASAAPAHSATPQLTQNRGLPACAIPEVLGQSPMGVITLLG